MTAKVKGKGKSKETLKENTHSQRNFQSQLCYLRLSHTMQEHMESLIQGKIHNQQN